MVSMYMQTILVFSSASSIGRRSHGLTFVILPMDTTTENPTSSSPAKSIKLAPSAPDCVRNATLPTGGVSERMVALRRTPGAVFATPMQFGPTMRILYLSTMRISSFSRAAPSGPISRNPAVMQTSAGTPFWPQASATSRTPAEGTERTPRSTLPGISRTSV